MKTTARTVLSAAAGFGLAAFTLVSAFTAGINGSTTVIAFSLLAIYGLLEIAMLSYAAPRFEVRRVRADHRSDANATLARAYDVNATAEDYEDRRAA